MGNDGQIEAELHAISIFSMFSTETTGQIFTKILHDIVALAALLNHSYTRR